MSPARRRETPWIIRGETPEQCFHSGEFRYSLLSERGEAAIIGYTGEAQEVVVPAELGGCPVREIRDFGIKPVKRVVLPDGLLETPKHSRKPRSKKLKSPPAYSASAPTLSAAHHG